MNQSSGTLYRSKYTDIPVDYIFRIKESANSEYQVNLLGKSEIVFSRLTTSFLENSVLKLALNNLWNAYQYTQEYNSYLLNLCTKEEFLEKAQSYVMGYKDIDAVQLTFASNLVLNTLNQPMTSAELSVLLNVDHKDIEQSCVGLIEYNPDNDELE